MVTGQASDQTDRETGNPLSASTANRLLNLLELSQSDLTTFTGGEELPVTEMLRDTLLSVLKGLRPDLLAHSQRVAFLCYGIARQCGWTSRKSSTLVTAALLHEIGSVIVPTDLPFWEITSTESEELSRRVSVDLLAACHADSELLEILTLSQNFRYREPLPEESASPTPPHVILGSAAFHFAHLFDAVRHRKQGQHDVAEIIAALNTLAETPEEHRVLESLEEWLSGRDPQVEQYDATLLQQQDLGMDEETLNIVHATFLEILFELYDLEEKYQGFFVLDATGRFLLWNYGCQRRLGHTMREMRNKHWTNQLMGYCNEEGLAFSGSQTPLYQTLESAKPAHLTLCLKNPAGSLLETEVNSVPILGRDGLLLGIVEVHRGLSDQHENSKPELMLTPEWVGDLVDTIHDLDDNAEPIAEVRELDDSYLIAIEKQLGITGMIDPPSASVNSVAAVIEKAEEIISNDSAEIDIEEAMAQSTLDHVEDLSSTDVSEEVIDENLTSDILEEATDQEPIEESESTISEPSIAQVEEEFSAEEAVASPSTENLDELFSRFDSLVSSDQDLEQDDATNVPEESTENQIESTAADFSEHSAEVEDVVVESSDETEEERQDEESGAESLLADVPDPETEDEQPAALESDLEPLAESDIELPEQVDEISLEEQFVVEELSDAEATDTEAIDTEAIDEEAIDEEAPVLGEEGISEESIEENSDLEPLEEQQEEFPFELSDVEIPVTDESHEEVAEQLDVEEVEGVEEEVAVEEPVEAELNSNAAEDSDIEQQLEQEEPKEPVAETPQELLGPQTQVEESPEVPATIELPEETPLPDPGQTDPLAQPVSRKEWDAFVEHLMDSASPEHEQVSVLFLDVDHFKAINEGFGRQIGTDLLTEISRRLSQACGKRELSCRYGGGQFTIACPGINLEKARKRGDQFRKLIDRTRFDVLPFHSLTVSVGIASFEEGDDLTELMNRAEHALYQAKQSGRNCSVGLSAADIEIEMKAVENNMPNLITGEYDVETHFEAMVASDMIVYKLGGFLYDMHAKLLHVDRRHVSMRVGKKGLLPYWGRQDDDRPVLIDLELGEGWNQQRSEKGLLTNTRINVKIRPDGWVRSQETFLKRAHFVLRELKGYFVSN